MKKNIFIDRAIKSHGDKYSYDEVENEINVKSKISIYCKKCKKIFEQIADNHIRNHGCPLCNKKRDKLKSNRLKFIEKANIVHNSKYDYSFVNYINAVTKIEINCLKHGLFHQTPNNHLSGKSCPECSKESRKLKLSLSFDDFLNKSNSVHNNKFSYIKESFISSKKHVEIICPKHGKFIQRADVHMNGQSCPSCYSSKGENSIINVLNGNNIRFVREKIFDDCKNTRKLKFDFFLPDDNIVIEFDGKQHFEPIEFFGGKIGFEKQKINDHIKNEYLKKIGIKLIRIPYFDYDLIPNIINEKICNEKRLRQI